MAFFYFKEFLKSSHSWSEYNLSLTTMKIPHSKTFAKQKTTYK